MQSYTFDQLDERGQKNARAKYWDEATHNYPDFLSRSSPEVLVYFIGFVDGGSWRFNEHGERIA